MLYFPNLFRLSCLHQGGNPNCILIEALYQFGFSPTWLKFCKTHIVYYAMCKLMLKLGGHTLKFTSWNVKGLNQPVKRSKVLHHLQSLGTHIAFLQETHLKTDNHSLLPKQWVGQMYPSHYSCKARGTAILIHIYMPFTLSNTKLDKKC